MTLVHRSWSSIPSSQPNDLHWDPQHGPNLYDVNTYIVKPMTLAAGGASYALMKHPEGLDCEVFVSHSWQGGIFHLRNGVKRAWPQLLRLQNLYCCLLSNPQNLDLNEFIGGNLSETAFALALQKASHMLVVPNPSMAVYSRLWCVFEAYLGAKWKKIYLLPVVPARAETWKLWFQKVGRWMLLGFVLGIPVWLCLEPLRGTGLYTLLGLIYRLLCLLASLLVIPFWHHPRCLEMMSFLTFLGSIFLLMDVLWSYIEVEDQDDNWVSVLFHYGWVSNLTPMNALITVLLVILKGEKDRFEQQKKMMQFQSLADSHCSISEDERRIREVIAGSEEEVETVISILLTAGAYTDNLRHAWDSGLDIERAGMTDVKTGVFFCVLTWTVCALDLWSDTFIAALAHQDLFQLLCVLYTLTALLGVPISVWRLERKGPDFAVFAMKTWGLLGVLSLQLPILLCYLEGFDEASNMPLMSFFNGTILATVDSQTWKDSDLFDLTITRTVWLTRFLCLIFAWTIVCAGVERWNRLQICFLSLFAATKGIQSQSQDSEDNDSSASEDNDFLRDSFSEETNSN